MTLIIILAVAGILAILAELVLPGGILGVLGALSLLIAVGLTFFHYGAIAGMIGLALLIVLGIFTFGWWMKFFHRLPGTKQLILHNASGVEDGSKANLVGQTGEAITDLVPSGRIVIDGQKHDAIAESDRILKGDGVVVVAESGMGLTVRPVEVS